MAMSGGTSYLVRSKRANYGNDSWTIDLYVYVKLLSQDKVKNQSKISLGLYVYSKYNIEWTDHGINGTSYVGTATSGTNCFTFTKDRFGSGTYWLTENHEVTVTHKSDGTLSLPVYWHWGVNSAWGQYVGPSGSVNVTLTAIDRTAPTVSCSTVVNSSTGMTIKATASTPCDRWEYSLDGGSSWVQYSTASGTTANKTLTGLTSNVYSVRVRARKSSNHVIGTSGAISTDLVAPTVTLTASNITANALCITAKTNVVCDVWEYSLNGGSTWTQYSTVAGTSSVKTILGLTANTDYLVKVRARKKSNQVKASSTTKAVKTLGGTVINSVNTLAIDVENPVIQMNWTVYNSSYTHKLVVKNGATVLLTIEGLTASSGTINTTYALTSEQRATVLRAMKNEAYISATYELTSYEGSVQIGSACSCEGTIRTTSELSKPVFGGFSFADVNLTTFTLTENDQLMVQNHSSLRVVCETATAMNEASIAKYRVTIGSKTVESDSPTVDFGTIDTPGSKTVMVFAVDSRGYSTVQTQTLTVLPYESIRLNNWSIRRVNEVEESANLSFEGEYSPLIIDDIAKNNAVNVTYFYWKKSDGAGSEWEEIEASVSGGKFTYTSSAFGSFDADSSFMIIVRAADALTQCDAVLSLPKGTPLVAYRSKKVGINNNDPTSALDVIGEIKQNGQGILGMVGVVGDDLNGHKNGGIYWKSAGAAVENAPSDSGGFLLVLSWSGNVTQMFTNGVALFLRAYDSDSDAWSSWLTK